MPKKIKQKLYICPSCNEKQTSAIEWQNESVAYEFKLKSGKSEEVDKVCGEHENWTCPSCGEDLPIEMWDSIQEMLGW